MTTLDDFHKTLSQDRADWLVLADWLEERGDERAQWVRYAADNNLLAAPLAYENSPGWEDYWLDMVVSHAQNRKRFEDDQYNWKDDPDFNQHG